MWGITFNLEGLGPSANVTAMGSSSPYGGGGDSLGMYVGITCLSLSTNAFCLNANSTGPEPGMFTGSTWINTYVSAPCDINLGNNQDDGTMIGTRLQSDGSCTHGQYELSVESNWDFIDTYANIPDAPPYPNEAAIGCTNGTEFNGLFIESSGTTDIDWPLQYNSGAVGVCKITRLNTNLTMSGGSADSALIRVNAPTGSSNVQGIQLGNFYESSGTTPPYLFSIFNGSSTATGTINLNITGYGWNAFATKFAIMGSGGTTNSNDVLTFTGCFNGNCGLYKAPAAASLSSPSWTLSTPAAGPIAF